MADIGTATENSEDQPIWVKDLIAWLKKIEGEKLIRDEWVARVQEVLVELPGQGLPEELWPKGKESAETAEAVQEDVEVKLPPLSDEDITRIQKELETAQGIQNEYSRSEGLAAVAFQLRTSEPQLLQQLLEAAQGIQNEDYRRRALYNVAAQLPASEPQLLQQALEAAQGIQNEDFRGQVLCAVAAQLPASEPQLLQQALEAAQGIQNEYSRRHALVDVVAQLPASEPQLFQQALEAAQGIQEEYYRRPALAAVAAQLPASERQSVIQQALVAAQGIQSEYSPSRSQALAAVAAQLPESERQSVLQEALEAAQGIQSESIRHHALVDVAAQLPASEPQLLQQVLEAAQGIQEELFRSAALAAVVAQLPALEPQLLQQVLDAARGIRDEYYRRQALSAVAAQLPESERQSVLQQALEAAQGIQNEPYRSHALAAVATQLPASERQSVLQQALEAAQGIQNEDFRSAALAAVVAKLPESEPQLFQQALEAAQGIRDEYYRSQALAAVAAQLPASEPKPLQEALEAARGIQNKYYRSQALAAVAAKLPASERQSVLQEALWAAQGIQNKSSRSEVLAAVAIQLPASEPQLLQQVLEAARGIQNEDFRNEVLAAVTAQLPASEHEIIQIALDLEDRKSRIIVLTNLAFQSTETLILHCPPILLSTALEIVPQGKNSAYKNRLLSALAPRLTVGLFPRALQLIQTEITHPVYQVESIGNLAPYLPSKSLTEALEIVRTHIPGYTYPTNALCHLIPYLSLPQLRKALDIFDERKLNTYSNLLTSLFHQAAIRLSNPNFRQSEPDKPTEKKQLVEDILLKLSQQSSISEKAFTTVLIALLPSIQESDLKSIQEIIRQISEYDRAQVLAAIATLPNLTPEQLIPLHKQAEEQAEGWQDRPKATTLSAFIAIAPELHAKVIALIDLSPNSIRKADLALILAIRPHPDPYNNSALAELKTDQIRALRLIREEPNEVAKAKALLQLAPHLLPSQILEAQGVAQDIQDRYQRSRSLLALATHFPEIRAEAERQIDQVKKTQTENDESDDKYLILHIELLSQFATTVPEQIPTLLKSVEDWSKANPFDSEGDRRTYKRRRILIALKPHLPLRLVREIDRQTAIGKAPQDLWDRALFVLRNEYRQALKTGSLRNDANQDEDLLNLKDEINALTEMLLMRDLEPPVAVGILGGWGGGKSYIMHLMQTHMVAIRSQGMEAIEAWGLKDDKSTSPDGDRVGRFVGHIYQIKFDAWTYAKSDLWASLMQTIFFELDRQLTLETQLTEVLSRPLYDNQRQVIESKVWPVLYKSSDDEREWFLKQVLKDEEFLKKLREKQDSEGTTGILWEKFKESQNEAIHSLDITEKALKTKKQELEESKSALRNQIRQEFDPIFNIKKNDSFQKIDALLGTSFVLLRRRIGQSAFKDLNIEIYKQLAKGSSPNKQKSESSDQSIGLWKTLERKLQELEKARKELEELEKKSESTSTHTTQEDTELSAKETIDLSKSLEAKVTRLLKEVSESKFDVFNVAANVIEKKQGFSWERNCQWLKNNWLLVFLFLGLFVAPLILLAWLGFDIWHKANLEIKNISVKLATLIAPLLPGVVILQNLMRSGQKWFEETRLALHEYEISVRNRNQEIEASYERSIKESFQADPHLQRLEKEVQELERAYEEQKRAAPLNQYASLSAFVSDRLDQGTYKNRLGLMQQVKQDLADLSNKLLPPSQYEESFQAKIESLKKVFPRGPARVILYIDDLDRCPPNTVVEVLEAVQLLVKNPLFIAVLAIDERYINRALAQHYKGVLSLQGSPSAADYLEKIIQIPYRVRPIAEDALRSYLRAQTVIQDSETSGTKFNEFSPQEFNRLVNCCQEVELSPRSLKRLTNVYKLYKILSRTRGQRPTPREQQAILTLLAFSSRYPDLMRGILQEIGSHYEEGRHHKEEDNETLANIFDISLKKYENISEDNPLAQDAKKLRHDMEKLVEKDLKDLKLNEIHDIFTFVRTFSFVGDIGVDVTASARGDHSI